MHTSVETVKIPRLTVSYVLIQYKRLILSKDTYRINAGIDAVRKRKIDNTILAAKWNCRFCKLLGQCIQT